MSMMDTAELEARVSAQEEAKKKADLLVDWLDGKLPPSEPQQAPSPALERMQAEAEAWGRRYRGPDRAAEAAKHEERLAERAAKVAEAHERRQKSWRPGAKAKVVSTGGGYSRHAIEYE